MSIERNNIEYPDYLNLRFFEAVLENGLNDSTVVLKNVKFTSGHKPGENYCSVIYRADVTYKTSTQSLTTVPLIIKTQVLNDDYKTADFFGKEANMYKIAFPKIQHLLEDVQIAPKFYYSTRKPTDIIVFHDMTPSGYSLADRTRGLDEEHCALVLCKLAQYHAASMEYARHVYAFEDNPDAFIMFEEGMINSESNKFVETLLTDILGDTADLVKTWPGYELMSEKLLNLKSSIFSIFKEANDPVNNEVKVLTHNDLWTNNILFKYNGSKVEDVLLIDFQASYYCSPGIDLTHFLYTTPQFHLLKNIRQHMIEDYYYKTFKATLEDLNYTAIPTLVEIYNEIGKRELSGFLWAVAKLYIICMDKDDCSENSIENLVDPEIGKKIRAKGMSSERFQMTLKYMLKRLNRIGKI